MPNYYTLKIKSTGSNAGGRTLIANDLRSEAEVEVAIKNAQTKFAGDLAGFERIDPDGTHISLDANGKAILV